MTTRRRVQKAMQERLAKSLSDAHGILGEAVELAEQGDSRVFDTLEEFDSAIGRAYRQAERLEGSN